MLTLSGRALAIHDVPATAGRMLMRVRTRQDVPIEDRIKDAFFGSIGSLPEGFGAYVALARDADSLASRPRGAPGFVLPDSFEYLADGDIMRLVPKNRELRVLYRRNSQNNNFLVTERCNHYCLMCSQPPKDIDDRWIVDEILAALPLIDRTTPELGFTGGEPTLLGDDFLRIIRTAKEVLPETALHILSNGRAFVDAGFTQRYAAVNHPDMMIGIPIYSDSSTIHDYVVQADGAFDETIKGILNLKRYGQKVEIRVVIHRQTYERLPQLAEFLARNLTFADHVTLMGLEITGFTRANLDQLWIDPVDYQSQLYRAAMHLADHRMHVSIYNHQLCVLDRRLWPFARKSISDWKNEYMPECDGCSEQEKCGGFFSSSKFRYSDHIRAL